MFRKPVPLSEHHLVDDFDSGKPALDGFLKDMALYNQQQEYTRTVVIATEDYRVVGYHSLCAGMISRNSAPRQVKGHRAPGEIPVALLARLAVDRRHQNVGLGRALLKHALMSVVSSSRSVAFRAVMVHALDDEAEAFYLKFGFRAAKGLERTLLLPTKDIVASLAQAT
ncbi:GNAT family N-acetyltransferase [Rhizobium metallidurans]|uniref:Putative N-acetyltransferase YhbS n=1 Tax=Rhizobium metallidurans TaxID=1265931 RepID=A0A7W6CMK1_9HYPH|nr:GNAT family N-acetyltransferase [Rhizobium metallidurans]MBB3963733.1 putative N-acetyltransferase YhbS [Rhizobium metallidurans]